MLSLTLNSCIKQHANKEKRTKKENAHSSSLRVQRRPSKKVKQTNQENAKDFMRQQEAKLVDIPVPLGSVPCVANYHISEYVPEQAHADEVMLAYDSQLSLSDIKDFYKQEMERLGWCNIATYEQSESLFLFKKPDRLCAVSVRPYQHQNKAAIIIFSGKKEAR